MKYLPLEVKRYKKQINSTDVIMSNIFYTNTVYFNVFTAYAPVSFHILRTIRASMKYLPLDVFKVTNNQSYKQVKKVIPN